MLAPDEPGTLRTPPAVGAHVRIDVALRRDHHRHRPRRHADAVHDEPRQIAGQLVPDVREGRALGGTVVAEGLQTQHGEDSEAPVLGGDGGRESGVRVGQQMFLVGVGRMRIDQRCRFSRFPGTYRGGRHVQPHPSGESEGRRRTPARQRESEFAPALVQQVDPCRRSAQSAPCLTSGGVEDLREVRAPYGYGAGPVAAMRISSWSAARHGTAPSSAALGVESGSVAFTLINHYSVGGGFARALRGGRPGDARRMLRAPGRAVHALRHAVPVRLPLAAATVPQRPRLVLSGSWAAAAVVRAVTRVTACAARSVSRQESVVLQRGRGRSPVVRPQSQPHRPGHRLSADASASVDDSLRAGSPWRVRLPVSRRPGNGGSPRGVAVDPARPGRVRGWMCQARADGACDPYRFSCSATACRSSSEKFLSATAREMSTAPTRALRVSIASARVFSVSSLRPVMSSR